MKLATKRIYLIILAALTCLQTNAQVSAVYCGGPAYYGRDYSIDELMNSGFNTLIIWTIHINEKGDLNLNAEFPIVEDGVYVGDEKYPEFRKDVKKLKSRKSTINRIELGLSAWESKTYDNIKILVEKEGTGPESTLYKNFKALKKAFSQVDAINNDDELTYDVESSVAFHAMLFKIGFKTTTAPYTKAESYWKPFTEKLNEMHPGALDRTYLQVYAGGAGNKPCDEKWQYGVPVYPGLWGGQKRNSPSQVQDRMKSWNKSCGIEGGFLWLYDDFDNSPMMKEYANAVRKAFEGTVIK